jgi:curved DNA-binding protein CbpA
VLVDNIIIKILISEQLSQQEKQEMLNAYRDGRLKKQYRRYAKAYHPDRNPDPRAKLTFQELGNINAILEKLRDGESLTENDIKTMIDMVGRQKAFAIPLFRDAYEAVMGNQQQQQQQPQQQRRQRQRKSSIAEIFNNINDMRTFFNTYKRIMMNSRDPNKGQKLQNFYYLINTWYQEARKSRFSNDYTRDLDAMTDYLSSLGTGGEEVRDAFKRIYMARRSEAMRQRQQRQSGPTRAVIAGANNALRTQDLESFLTLYIKLVDFASSYLSQQRVESAKSGAQQILSKIQLIKGQMGFDQELARQTYENYEKDFFNTESTDPNVASYNFISNLDTGVDMRSHAAELFEDGALYPI